MCKKYFDIFNKFIFYTKKCHIFHILVVSCSPITFLLIFCILVILPLLTIELLFDHNIEEYCKTLDLCFGVTLYMNMIVSTGLLFFALPAYAIFILIKYIQHKSFFTTNKFLLENKWYNLFYIFSILGIIFSFIFLT